MGYTTTFRGRFELNKPLTVPDWNELQEFAEDEHNGQEFPNSYCQWVPSRDGLGIEWDGNEKFYYYVEWLEYIIEHFLKPKGYVLNGAVPYQGEEMDDMGQLEVKDNEVKDIEMKAVGIVECPHCGERFIPDEE